MKRILYVSAAAREIGDGEMTEILEVSRRRNAATGISGLLLHLDGGFLQILEGPEAAVDETYARIAGDPRHTRVTLLWSEPASARAFPGWSMGHDAVPENDPRWEGAFRIDPLKPAEALAAGCGPAVMALMQTFYDTSSAGRYA